MYIDNKYSNEKYSNKCKDNNCRICNPINEDNFDDNLKHCSDNSTCKPKPICVTGPTGATERIIYAQLYYN